MRFAELVAKLLNTGQPVRTRVLVPGASYSRVIGVWCQVKGFGDHGWGYSPALGNRLWLRSVSVYFSPEQDQAGQQICYGICRGTRRPTSYAQVHGWEAIIPIYFPDGRVGQFTQTMASNAMSWTMNQLFEGGQIRFGAWIYGSGFVGLCEMYAFFEISEG